jgi:hypothetical protein
VIASAPFGVFTDAAKVTWDDGTKIEFAAGDVSETEAAALVVTGAAKVGNCRFRP